MVTTCWGEGHFFPLGRWPHCYSSKGEMVMVFPLGTLAFGYSQLGERVGLLNYSLLGETVDKLVLVFHWGSWFMVTPRWGRGWVA